MSAKTRKKTTRHWHVRKVKSGLTPVRQHPMRYWESRKYRINVNRLDGKVSSIELYDKRQNENVAHVLPFGGGIVHLFQYDLTKPQMDYLEKIEEEWTVNTRGKDYNTLRDEIVEAVRTKDTILYGRDAGLYKYVDLIGQLTPSERARLSRDPTFLAMRRRQ